MKIYFLLLVISLLFEINCSCWAIEGQIESPNAEECFSRTVTLKEIGEGGNVEDFLCCYLKEFESANSECFVLEKSRISTIAKELTDEQGGMAPYAVGCSLDQLPDESKSNYCTLQNPIKKSYCFSRPLNASEKAKNNGFTPDKCCYFETNSLINHCLPMEESKVDEYIKNLKEIMKAYDQNTDDMKAYCTESSINSGESHSSDKTSAKLFLIMLLMFL